jgi:glutamate 5-kinase
MQAKLEAALLSLAGGISEVVIAAGREPEICRYLLSGEAVGTRIHGVA